MKISLPEDALPGVRASHVVFSACKHQQALVRNLETSGPQQEEH